MKTTEFDIYACYFDSTHQPLILLTKTGIIIKANAAALQRMGSNDSHFDGQLFSDTDWWSYKLLKGMTVTAAIIKAANGQHSTAMAIFPTANTATCIIDFSFIPLRNSNNDVHCVMAEGIDITESINAFRLSHYQPTIY